MHPPDHPTLLTDDDLAGELAGSRRNVSRLLHAIDTFATIEHDQPWLYLDDLLRELRLAAVTVATLERLQAARPM